MHMKRNARRNIFGKPDGIPRRAIEGQNSREGPPGHHNHITTENENTTMEMGAREATQVGTEVGQHSGKDDASGGEVPGMTQTARADAITEET